MGSGKTRRLPISGLIRSKGSDWANGSPLGFMQTTVTIHNARISVLIAPGFYTIYSGPERKSFLSDSSVKMAHAAVIRQVAAYGKWAEGYPACVVDPEIDVGESLVLINPHERPAVATIEIEGHDSIRIKVPSSHSRRVDVGEGLKNGALPWRGQILCHRTQTGCRVFRQSFAGRPDARRKHGAHGPIPWRNSMASIDQSASLEIQI